jgi:hypothetical protein
LHENPQSAIFFANSVSLQQFNPNASANMRQFGEADSICISAGIYTILKRLRTTQLCRRGRQFALASPSRLRLSLAATASESKQLLDTHEVAIALCGSQQNWN